MRTTISGCLFISLLSAGGAWGQAFSPGGVDPVTGQAYKAPADLQGRSLDFHADLQTVGIYRNDSDFSRAEPFYDHGQSRGGVATILTPRLWLHLSDDIFIYYEAELGLNYWSRNNPDEEDPTARDIFILKHREVFAEGQVLDRRLHFKVGYQRFLDTTGLFINHWLGAAQLYYNFGDAGRFGVFFAQVPDNTYEGITLRDNNFDADTFLFGARADLRLSQELRLSLALHDLWDKHVVGKRLYVIAPNFRLVGQFGFVTAWIDGVFQYGEREASAVDSSGKPTDQTLLAWAWQAHAAFQLSPITLTFNVFALSPDDKDPGNTRDGAFLYSAKNQSATVMLTEDEVRDVYDNLDERLAVKGSEAGVPRFSFYQLRPGFLVGDARITYEVASFFRPALTIGAATVLKSENALGNRYLGTEIGLDLEFTALEKHLIAHLAPGVLVPGKAASLFNQIDVGAEADRPMWWVVASLMLRY